MSTTTEPNAATAPKTLKEATALLAERDTALSAAQQKLTELETSHAEALAAVTSERDTLRSQFDSAVEASTKTAEELAAVRKEFEGEKTARTAAEERASKAEENSSRLEKLCQVKGIDPSAAVPTGTETPDGVVHGREELRRQYAQIKDSGERARFYAKHKDSLLD